MTRKPRATSVPTKEWVQNVRSSPRPATSRITGSAASPWSRKQIVSPDATVANWSSADRAVLSDMGRPPRVELAGGAPLRRVEREVVVGHGATERPGVVGVVHRHPPRSLEALLGSERLGAL